MQLVCKKEPQVDAGIFLCYDESEIQTKEELYMRDFSKGFRLGIPVMLGYLPVSFTYGTTVVKNGLPPLVAILISATNLTSSGQFAGTNLILQGASYFEIAVTVLIINIRYLLMALSLTQKTCPMTLPQRAAVAFGVTDEVFALAATTKQPLTFPFLMGLIAGPFFGWTAGTILGAYTIGLLPATLQNAMGIALYAMFIAIIVPPLRKSRPILCVTAIAVGLSCLLTCLPVLRGLSSGWTILLASIPAAAIGAKLFPVGGDGND